MEKEGFGKKSHKLLIDSLEKSKQTELPLLLFALGIPLIGEQTAQKISEKIYKQFEEKAKGDLDLNKALFFLERITNKDLEEITDIGPMASQSFLIAFQNKELVEDLKRLNEKGVFFKKKNKKETKLKGLKIAITGTFPLPRQEIQQKILEQGGQVSSQLSQKTSFLLVGEKPGSKKDKALKLSVQILKWEDFLKLIR